MYCISGIAHKLACNIGPLVACGMKRFEANVTYLVAFDSPKTAES